jgi:1-acyl-sn-glycerol-3-phosphate acyltransferase
MKHWPGGKCSPLAKKEIFYAWPFGLGVWLAGITFIDRLHPERARGTINQLVDQIKNDQVCSFFLFDIDHFLFNFNFFIL